MLLCQQTKTYWNYHLITVKPPVFRKKEFMHQTRMWANAQRDGRPAEYRWHPLVNATRFGWRPILECRAVTLPRRRNPLKFVGCPKLPDLSQPLVGQSSPYCANVWRRYRCLTIFFLIVHKFLSCEDIARQSCAMVPRWRLFGDFFRPVFAARAVQHVSDLHLKFALRPYHVCKYCRHQYATAEIRRGKKDIEDRNQRAKM